MQFGASSKARARERARAKVKAKAKERITASHSESRTQVQVQVHRGTLSGQVVASRKAKAKPKEVKDLGRRVKERVEDPVTSVARMVTSPANAGRAAEKVVIEDSLRR